MTREPSVDLDNPDIFSSKESAWDHVFRDIKEMPPLLPTALHESRAPPRSANPQSRRQAMTAREISAFDEMFNMIFNAVSEQKTEGDVSGPVGIGRAGRGMSDLFGKLRRHGKKLKWTNDSEEELDRKREEMELCDTDQQLLEWSMREIFAESKRYEEAARRAIDRAAEASSRDEKVPMPPLHPMWYPHLLSQLIRTFRDKYRDPHLALSIFDHAKHLSIPSYVFGCTTPAYNELIETRWRCFRDLRGVCDALEEMRANAVGPDARTRTLVENMRKEVSEQKVWEDESSFGSGEVLHLLDKAHSLSSRAARQQRQPVAFTDDGARRDVRAQNSSENVRGNRRWTSRSEWKTREAFEGDSDDDYEFGWKR
jgi:hypothetical protein